MFDAFGSHTVLFFLFSGERPEFDSNKHKFGKDLMQLVEAMWSEAPEHRPNMKEVVRKLSARTVDHFGQSNDPKEEGENSWGRGIQVIEPTFAKEDVHDFIKSNVVKASLDSSQNHVSKLLAGVRQYVEDHDELDNNEKIAVSYCGGAGVAHTLRRAVESEGGDIEFGADFT